MLVLSRRVGEIINIGDDIKIVVAFIEGNQVKLCIEAPKEIPVHRNEVYEAIKSGITREERKKMTVQRYGRADKGAVINPPTVTNKKKRFFSSIQKGEQYDR